MAVPETDKGSAARRWLRAAGALCLCLAAAGFAGFLRFAESIALEEARLDRRGAAAIVLTGGAERIPDAIELLERGHAARLLITGANVSLTLADVARLAPRSTGVIECCVDLGYEARNTIGNAREARQWLATHDLRGPVIVVTSNYHMPRALLELGHASPDMDWIPYPVVTGRLRHGAWWSDLAMARLWVGEYVKYLAAAVRIALRPSSQR